MLLESLLYCWWVVGPLQYCVSFSGGLRVVSCIDTARPESCVQHTHPYSAILYSDIFIDRNQISVSIKEGARYRVAVQISNFLDHFCLFPYIRPIWLDFMQP
jgi:hypothetical protein